MLLGMSPELAFFSPPYVNGSWREQFLQTLFGLHAGTFQSLARQRP